MVLDFLCGIVIFIFIVVVFCCLWFKIVCLNLLLESSMFLWDNFWIILLIMLFLVFLVKCGLIRFVLIMLVNLLMLVILFFWLVWDCFLVFFVAAVVFGLAVGGVFLGMGDFVIFFFSILINRVVIREFVVIVIKNINIWLIVLSMVIIGLLCVILFFIWLIIVIIELVIEFVIIFGIIWRGFWVVNGIVFFVILKRFIVNEVFFIFFFDVVNFFFFKNVVILSFIGGI